MCGIFGYIGRRHDAAKIVFDGLKRLEYRGYDSWGIAVRRIGEIRESENRRNQRIRESEGRKLLSRSMWEQLAW